MMKKTYQDYLYVGLQFILFLAFALIPYKFTVEAYPYLFYTGVILLIAGGAILLLAFLQLNTNLTPFPSPKANGTLIQSGIYAFIRHPIYTSILLICLGFSLKNGSGSHFLITMALFILFYFKSQFEEKQLRAKFEVYADYATRTGRFFPIPFRLLKRK